MLIDFDKFGMVERPVLTLSKPNRQELGQMGSYKELTYDPVLQSYSTINFKYPYYAQGKRVSNHYDEVQNQMLVTLEGIGEFVISSCEEENTGAERYKQITANSSEYLLCKRKINVLNGTYKLYDIAEPEKSLLHKLFEAIPSWSIGYISIDLLGKSRTFDVPDSTLYDFLMNEVSKAFECIFVFDTLERKINAYTVNDTKLIKDSDVYISYGNFLKSEKIEEISEELVTVMSCYGGDGVNISSVNPTGTIYLYDFSHFKNMMSDELKSALNNWEAAYAKHLKPHEDGEADTYSDLLLELKELNSRLITAETDLKELESSKVSKEEIQAIKIAGGKASGTEYDDLVKDIKTVVSAIANQKTTISGINAEIQSIKSKTKAINTELSFSVNGSYFKGKEELLKELDYFMYESTYQDDNYIITDAMDLVEQQDIIQQLYDSCSRLMKDASRPTYNITADTVNFLFIEKLAPYINSIYKGVDNDPSSVHMIKDLLGLKFHLEKDEDEWIEPVLLKMHINFDDPTDFSMEFSTRYRLYSDIWTYGDLVGEAISTAGNVSFDYSSIKTWNDHRDNLLDFANNSLDMTRKNLVNNSENQTFLIDKTGLRGHSSNNEGEETRKGIWLTADTLAFTNDNWQTVKTAVGNIYMGENQSSRYGVNAEVLIGKAILGNELTISNEANTMTVDNNGLTVTSNFESTENNVTISGSNRILISPGAGISIERKQGNGNYSKQFYVDSATGNVILAGNIEATGGKIAGFTISASGSGTNKVYTLASDSNKIKLSSDGTATIGDLEIKNGVTTFDGTIYADKIVVSSTDNTKIMSGSYLNTGIIGAKSITDTYIGSVSGDKINAGTITAGKIGAGEISYGATCVNSSSFDAIYAKSANIESLVAKYAQIDWLQGAPQYNNGYYEVKVAGALETSTWLEAGTNISAGGWLDVSGNATIGGTLTTSGTASIGGNLKLYTDGTWRTVKISGSKGYIPTNANILYIELP